MPSPVVGPCRCRDQRAPAGGTAAGDRRRPVVAWPAGRRGRRRRRGGRADRRRGVRTGHGHAAGPSTLACRWGRRPHGGAGAGHCRLVPGRAPDVGRGRRRPPGPAAGWLGRWHLRVRRSALVTRPRSPCPPSRPDLGAGSAASSCGPSAQVDDGGHRRRHARARRAGAGQRRAPATRPEDAPGAVDLRATAAPATGPRRPRRRRAAPRRPGPLGRPARGRLRTRTSPSRRTCSGS